MPTTIETLSIPNFASENILKELQLGADANPAQAVATLLNADGLLANDFLVYNPGAALSEILKLQSISGQAVTMTSNFLLQHRNHERVIKSYGDRINVYRTANVDGTIPSDSAFTLLGGTVIVPEQAYSYYTDNAGGSGFWYKYTYYNSVTLLETDKSNSVAIRGGGWGVYASIEQIRGEAGIEITRSLNDDGIAERRAESESEIDGKLSSAGYVLPLQTSSGILYVPEIIINIDKLLSAGFVLTKNFGTTKPNTNKSGTDKITMARDMLAEIQLNDTTLLDSNKQPLAKVPLVSGFPTDDFANDPTQAGPFFTMEDKF